MKARSQNIALMLFMLLLLGAAVVWGLSSRQPDALEQADQLFAEGHYHAALAQYRIIPAEDKRYPLALAHLGMLHSLRGELSEADQQLARAVGLGLDQHTLELVRLYQGQIAVQSGRPEEAHSLWALIPPTSAFRPLLLVLQVEQQLWSAAPANAEQSYREALAAGLPAAWAAHAHTRLALLRASSDPGTARAELAQAQNKEQNQSSAHDTVFIMPLLPASQPDAGQIQAILDAPAVQQPILLGQLYLQAELYSLAEAQFQRVTPDSEQAVPAAAFAAYTRWRSGDRAGGLEQLRILVERAPNESHVRALFALVAIDSNDVEETRAQLEIIRSLAPDDASTALAWGQWQASQRDYVEASRLYAEALERASPNQRGLYALHLARFNLATSWQLCEQGLPAAEEAVSRDASISALVLLSQIRLGCGNPEAAREAAERAIALDPRHAEALYRMGMALQRLGDRRAYEFFVRTADAQPASVWRKRAEDQIEQFDLQPE